MNQKPVSMASIQFLRQYRKNKTLKELEKTRNDKKHRRIVSENTSPVKKEKRKKDDDLLEEDEVFDLKHTYTGLEYNDLVFVDTPMLSPKKQDF